MGGGRQHAVRAGRHRHRRHRAHGDRNADPLDVRLLAQGDGGMSDPVRAGLAEALLLQVEIDRLNADYAAALDERRFDDWPLFFTEDASYIVQGRENFDRGLPLALIALESRGMM